MSIHKNAEEIFSKNLGHKIKAEVIASDEKYTVIFKGVLDEIICNQFFIKHEDKTVEMFRYEDIRNIQIIG